ncbi:competence protein A [mine drainage metagenome]|uniref:Competence protein A n=1 Tax=mine drainage metagenome TaxID=410659 RepID=A0A1J5QHH5_9ZZZZ
MKFDIFNERTPPLIGVDISASSVKMVELTEGTNGARRIESYAIASLPKDAVVDGNIASLEQVGEAVKRAWKLLGTREKRVAVALPAAAVISKKVLMQKGLREEDMELQVEAEANQYIPFSLDEVNIDFQILGDSPASPDEVEVIIAAARKEKIQDREAAAEAAGLKVVIMDVETYATEAAYRLAANQLPNAGRDQTVMIVDTGAVMMHINVLHNNQSVYIREQTFGGAQLTTEIQRRFGLSSEEAEVAKRRGGLPDSYESEVLHPFIQSLALEIARALQFFTSSTQFNRVDHIMLAGGCAAIPGLDQAVTERTQVNAIVANPFINMSLSGKIKQQSLALEAPALMIACGLAMRRFDA